MLNHGLQPFSVAFLNGQVFITTGSIEDCLNFLPNIANTLVGSLVEAREITHKLKLNRMVVKK